MSSEITSITESLGMIDAYYHGRSNVLSTYVVKGEKAAIVDPGPSASLKGVVKGLYDLSVDRKEVKYVLASHIHLDHAGGCWKLLELCPDAMLYVHPKGVSHMLDPSRLVESARGLFGNRVEEYGEVRGIPQDRIVSSEDRQTLDLGEGVGILTVWTPGHASHHQSFFVPRDRAILLGDAGGTYNQQLDVLMPTSPPPFNPELAVQSLEELMGLEPRIACYGHFGFAENAISMLRMHKDQLGLWTEVISRGLKIGRNASELYEDLRQSDFMLRDTPALAGSETELRERTPLTNMRGFVEYFKWLSEKKN